MFHGTLSAPQRRFLQKCYLIVIFGEVGVRLGGHIQVIASLLSDLENLMTPTASASASFSGSATLARGLAAANGVCCTEMFSHREYLIRFARRKLHDPALAEDVVHDVFEAVLAGRARFEGRSQLRSWLTAILKHKIVDLIRDRARYEAMDVESDDGAVADTLCPHARPDEQAEVRERLALTLAKIKGLPPALRDVMHWRVLHDEPTEAVCKRLDISQDSLFVRLHRARKQLLN